MTTVRQHYIPRLLLKGFASRIDGKKVFAYLVRKDEANKDGAIEVSTADIAVGKYFYGKEEENRLEPELAKRESVYGRMLDDLRSTRNDHALTDNLVPEFVVSMAIRTKNLRDSFRDSASYIVGQLNKYFSSDANLRRFILKNREAKEKIFESLAGKLSRRDKKAFMKNLPEILDRRGYELSRARNIFWQGMPDAVEKMCKKGHIAAMLSNDVIPARLDSLSHLSWHLKAVEGNMVLGDICCLFEVNSKGTFRSLTCKSDKIMAVYLPISAGQIIVGMPDNHNRQVRVGAINAASARSSMSFVVSSKPVERTNNLFKQIGRDAGFFSGNELEQIVKRKIAKL